MKSYSTSWTQKIAKGLLSLACVVSVSTAFAVGSFSENKIFNSTYTAAEDLPPCTGAPTEIGGTVFRDYNADGTQNGAEPGISGITVRAFDNDDPPGTPTATTTSAADGTYLLTGLSAGVKYRLEFTWTDNKLQPGAAGGTSVQVATAGACGNNLGLNNPGEYCQDNPKLVTSCYLEGPNIGNNGDVLIAMNFNTPVGSPTH